MSNSKKNSDNKPLCKYHCFDVFPAMVFFEVLKTKNIQLLRPKNGVPTEVLTDIYEQVHEDFFIKSENEDAERYIELSNKIKFLTYKKDSIRLITAFVLSVPSLLLDEPEVQEMVKSQIEALNKYLDTPIDFDIDLLDEALRVMNVEIGIIEDEINIATFEFNDLRNETEGKILDYYDKITALEDVHGRTLDERMLLPKYVAIEKAAKAKINRQKLQQAHGKK